MAQKKWRKSESDGKKKWREIESGDRKNGGKLTAMAIVKDRHTKIEENTSGNEV